jgi:hypothetical protein
MGYLQTERSANLSVFLVPPVGTKAQVEDPGKEETGEHNAQVETSGKEEAGDPAGDRQWMSLGEVLCDGDTVTLEVKYRPKAAQAGPVMLALENWNMNPVIVRQTKRTVALCVVPQAAWPPRSLSSKTEGISGNLGSAVVPPLQCLASCGLLNENNSPDSHVRRWALHVGKEARGAQASPVECLTVNTCPPSVRNMLNALAEEGGSASTRERMAAHARALCLQLFGNSRENNVALVTLTCTGKQIDLKKGLLKGRWDFEPNSLTEAVVVLVAGNCRVHSGGAGFNISSLKPTWGEGAMELSGVARSDLRGALASQCLIYGRWWEFREGRAQTVKSATTSDGVVFVYTRGKCPPACFFNCGNTACKGKYMKLST